MTEEEKERMYDIQNEEVMERTKQHFPDKHIRMEKHLHPTLGPIYYYYIEDKKSQE
jgi:hypothetical protein